MIRQELADLAWQAAAIRPKPPVRPDEPRTGLCRTCRHADTCLHLRSAREPVHRCEEFDLPAAPARRRTADRQEMDSDAQRLGLCAGCENRNTCMHARIDGGVWHCEEYR